jgi:excinuclease ABC subunit B
LEEKKIKVKYLHSDVETLERIKVIMELRQGKIDVLVGVNLLREGLDLPEVSLIGILDADKEGFLRSETSLIQTIGRAARHVRGQVVLYADTMTGSLTRALGETARRRAVQIAYNHEHGITPRGVTKKIGDIREMLGGEADTADVKKILSIEMTASPKEIKAVIADKKEEMRLAAENLLFETAALLRDEITELEKELNAKTKGKPSLRGRRMPA